MSKTKKLTVLALSVAISMVLSYVESLIPTFFPGVKIGLANTVSLFLIHTLGAPYAIGVAVVRIFLSTLLFGAFPTGLWFSYCGAVLSFAVMLPLTKFTPLGIVGVSVLGAVFHNLGQVLAFCIIMESAQLMLYFIPLFVSGIIGGIVVGAAAGIVIYKLKARLR